MRNTLVLFLVLVVASACTSQQTADKPSASESASNTVTLRTQAKLVVLDVVVTNGAGAPVNNLKREDFVLTESGAPQSIRSFDEHHASDANATDRLPATPTLPRGTFTNLTNISDKDPVTVLLLDKLNTAQIDQTYVRSQMLKYLKGAPPKGRIAIFGLNSRLYMMQGFTSNPEDLRRAVNADGAKESPLLDDPSGMGLQSESLSQQLAGSGVPVDSLQDFEADNASFTTSLRARYTLNAMSALGRYLANVPGRKNLVWFSSSFPLSVLPSGGSGVASGGSFTQQASFQTDFRETVNLLARSRIAVYPIDARGVPTLPFNSASLGHGTSGENYQNPGDDLGNLGTFAQNRADDETTMRDLARDTGGRAFLNTNALAEAVSNVIANGSNFYTMSYSPDNKKNDGGFRPINVKLSDAAKQHGYQLAFRHGYYADKSDSVKAEATSARQLLTTDGVAKPGADLASLSETMAHGMPPATQIIYKMQVQPKSDALSYALDASNLSGLPGFGKAKGPFRNYLVDFAVPSRQIEMTDAPDGHHHAKVDFITVVFDQEGKVVSMVQSAVTADLDDQHLAQFRTQALRTQQSISVPASGNFSLRTAIRDVQNNKVGGLEVPVALLRTLPVPTTTSAR